jgi:uncharacterized protein YecE (DUF72 family)
MADEQLTFGFLPPDEPPSAELLPRAEALRDRLARLAERNVYVGGSSWKYPGWLGQIYHPQRYQTRGRFSARRFNDECLAEYARVFRTVCGDFAFYQFPTADFWERMFAQLPPGFRIGLKVPEDITMQRFPEQPRYGERAGKENGHFLDAGLLRDQFLDLLEPYRDRLGPLIFEFTAIRSGPLAEPKQFVAALDRFFEQVPIGRFELSVEVRNPEFLEYPGYLECLRDHRVAHCITSWTRMPPAAEQLRIPGVLTAPHIVARFLLRPGRTYAQAVEQFAPYERVQDPYPEGRAALADVIRTALPDNRTCYTFVNNRFEGNTIETIETMLAESGLL